MAGSDRQQRILDYIESYVGGHGFPPSIREIGDKVGISSTSVVNYHLNKLTEKGLLEREGRVSRGLKLSSALTGTRIPLLGLIQAGQPIPVLETQTLAEAQDWVELTRQIVPAGKANLYALRVKGTSMIDALINDGDIVVMEAAETANNGEMVAAWIVDREETTLKRIYHEGRRVRLKPANPTIKDFVFDADNVQVQGKVIAVIRSLAA
jgi:repressor LexA